MAFKFIALFACLVAAAQAVAIPIHGGYGGHEVEHHAPAHYDFAYSVHDAHTGDIKSQHESRKGDVVHGSYSLIDSDGHKRTVEYTADHHNGFNAVVHREPTHIKIPQPVHKVAIAHAAPIHHAVIAAPVHHVAHVAHHVAPVVHHVAPVVHHVAAPAAHVSYGHSHVSVHGHGGSYHY